MDMAHVELELALYLGIVSREEEPKHFSFNNDNIIIMFEWRGAAIDLQSRG